jgi:hypothetical protein
MPDQRIWRTNLRKFGGAEYNFVRTDHYPREPRDREVIEFEIGGKKVRAKIVTIHGSHFWLDGHVRNQR